MVPDIAVEDNDASRNEVRHGGRYAAEIEIKIFDFGGPITAERRFDAAAHHRAGLGETDGSGTRAEGGARIDSIQIDLGERDAAGRVEQGWADREADASPHGGKPRNLVLDGLRKGVWRDS